MYQETRTRLTSDFSETVKMTFYIHPLKGSEKKLPEYFS